MREMQEALLVKVQELNMARIHNFPLKAEIESLRVFIDAEEKRLAKLKQRLKA